MRNIVILISGGGSNLRAIVRAAEQGAWQDRFDIRLAAVLSNEPQAGGLAIARQQGIATEVLDHRAFSGRDAFDAALAAAVDRHEPTLVVLAGFMRILTASFVARFEGRLINIHPSLLPAFPGLHTHQRALQAGCRVAGATVHRVTAQLDHGPILAQAVVPVLPDDSPATLAARVLTQEHIIYPRTILALMTASWPQSVGAGDAGQASEPRL
jgi:phosphoribosylglycinamide formyltransferase-1